MKKILSWLVPLVILPLILGVTVFVISTSVRATAESPIQAEIPQVVQPVSIPPEIEQQKSSLVDQVNALSQEWKNKYIKSGWVHVVTQQVLNSDTTNVAPDGSAAPNEFISDDWSFLDKEGNIIKGVFLQRNVNGDIIQVSIFKNKTFYNLTYGDVIAAPDALILTGDFGFSEIAGRLKNNLEKTTADVKGKKLLKFVAKEKYEHPSKFMEFNDPVAAINTIAY